MHKTAYDDARKFVEKYRKDGAGMVADIGSLDINGTLKPLFSGRCKGYHGIDICLGLNVDIVVDEPYNWREIKAESYDTVVSTQCLEHVPQPWLWIGEVARIARHGGLIYICAPNTMAYHACPVDCWRVWPNGMQALMEYGFLEVMDCYKNEHGDTTGIARKP